MSKSETTTRALPGAGEGQKRVAKVETQIAFDGKQSVFDGFKEIDDAFADKQN